MPKQTSSFITNYKPTDFIDAELVEKASLWILRIIMKTHGYREFMDEKGGFDYSYRELCYFLGLEKYAAMDEEQYTSAGVLDILFDVLEDVFAKYPKPKIFNSDQGSQYKSYEHTQLLKKHAIEISVNSKGKSIVKRTLKNVG